MIMGLPILLTVPESPQPPIMGESEGIREG